MILSSAELASFTTPTNSHPHDWLGLHPCTVGKNSGLVVRAYLRDASTCSLVEKTASGETVTPLEKLDPSGFFEGFLPGRKDHFRHLFRVTSYSGQTADLEDPYAFWPTLGDQDLHYFNEGSDTQAFRKIGSRILKHQGVDGVAFTVWAPSARRVSVVGDFNEWDGRYHLMRRLGSSGVWELFIPGIAPGSKYKYEILGADDKLRLKTDPCGTFFEPAPGNASIVLNVDAPYPWKDDKWMEKRGHTDWRSKPISIYEVHASSWKRRTAEGFRVLTYREMAAELVDYVADMGFTHIEFLPLNEFPFDGSWGYQVTGFFAPTQRFGTPHDFRFLVDACHARGIGVIIDWVPAHFPTDAFALAQLDGTHLYGHADPRQGFHQDWGTLIFNYGRHEVRNFLINSALNWLERYHVDGLRVDAVASMLYLDYSREHGQWIPNEHGGNHNLQAISFLRQFNDTVHRLHPGVLTIAEESTSFPGVSQPPSHGGLGFNFKWNMGWMHDTLRYFSTDALYRRHRHNDLTFGMLYQFSENFVQTFSHDEVVHGKGSLMNKMAAGSMADKARNLRSLYALQWMWPGKKCLFMGQEFGQSSEWNFAGQLDWSLLQYTDHLGTQRLVRDLNKLLQSQPALYQRDNNGDGFAWLRADQADHSLLAFLRFGNNSADSLLIACNFTPVTRTGVRYGVPTGGFWKEILNSDAAIYGGTGQGNLGGIEADNQEWDHQPHSVSLTLPGLSVIVLKRG